MRFRSLIRIRLLEATDVRGRGRQSDWYLVAVLKIPVA